MNKRSQSRAVFTNITIGLQLGITVFAFVYGGYRLDIYYNRSPVFVSIGAVLGMIVGFYHLIRELKGLNNKGNNGRDDNKSKWM